MRDADRRDDELIHLDPSRGPGQPAPVAGFLDRVVRGMGAPGTDAVELVFNRWGEVVGKVLAERTQPVTLEGGTLVLEADDPAVVTHVQWLEQDLVDKLAELLGPGRVTAVRVRVASARRQSRATRRGGPAGPA